MLLLAAVLLLLYAWRAQWPFAPSPAPSEIKPLAFVEVTGEVAHPGVYAFSQPPTIEEVWLRAGAPRTAPDKDKKLASGSRVEVTPSGGYQLAVMSGVQLLTLGLPLDLNQASAADLEAIPGLGPALAKRIVEYRQAHGPFKEINDLGEKILGFGKKKVKQIKPFLMVSETKESTDERR
jgi:competence protein ComEA